jgi:acyl-coenzyme A synthetase/AMP-(fatty) acid ligase
MTPLVGHAHGDAIVAHQDGRPVAVARFVADVVALADRMPSGGGAVLNGCAQRYGFAVTLCAAALAGRVSLLPPARSPQVLLRACAPWRDRGELVIVTDDPRALLDAPLLRPPAGAGAASQWPPPSIADDQGVALAFTSGSTGSPQPHAKTWGALVASARAEAAALGLTGAGPVALLATVPPQHMFGLETSVMLALANGFAFDAGQPLHPHAIAASLQRLPPERVLVTTPTHLRALVRTDVALPPMRLVVCATAPLEAALAAQVESRWGTRLLEIYGCTETGQVASRRTVAGDPWTPLPGVTLQRRGDGACWARGAPVAAPAPLADRLELLEDGRFRLLGRVADQLDVGGKRASLAGLNAALLELEGVQDGAFWLPPRETAEPPGAAEPPAVGARARRLVAFVVAPGADRVALLRALRERIDPLFMPRPLVTVERLPRDAVGKLPAAEFAGWALERLALARRARADGRARSPVAPPGATSTGPVAGLAAVPATTWTHAGRVEPDHPMLAGHFPGDPIVPGAWLLSFALRCAGDWSRTHAPDRRVAGLRAAKFQRPLRPGERFELALRPRGDALVAFEITRDGEPIASGSLAMERSR